MRTSILLALASLLGAISAQQTVYLIRHGEKPADDGDGLSAQGLERAQCLRNVFGASSGYNIDYIIAEQPKSSKIRSFSSSSFSLTGRSSIYCLIQGEINLNVNI